jgi:hypothetical protein
MSGSKPFAAWSLPVGVLLLFALARVFFPEPLRTAGARVADFGAYWTAAHVMLLGGNPYDFDEPYDGKPLFELQRWIEPGRTVPLPAWGPPVALAFVLPFALLDYVTARWLWLLCQLLALLGCAGVLWRLYGGPPGRVLIAWALCLGFYPVLQLISLGQLTLLSLVGLVGFLVLLRRQQFWWAGTCVGLTVVKPQLVVLFGLALLAWCFDPAGQRRRWLVVLGAAATVLLAGGIVLACDPRIYHQYSAAAVEHAPTWMIPPTLGSLLRILAGGQPYWLAWVPLCLGGAWVAWYYLRYRRDWDWTERLPVLLFVCLLTTPYGWIYDLSLLLIPLLQLAVWARRTRPLVLAGLVVLYVAAGSTALTLNLLKFDEYFLGWLAPLLLLVYLPFRLRQQVPVGVGHGG